MIRLKMFAILASIILTGCAKRLEHTPVIMTNVEKALISIEHVINNNPDKRSVSLDFANERFFSLSGRLINHATNKTVSYRNLGNINLHIKSDWYYMTLYNINNAAIHRFYFKNKASVIELANALYTLKQHKPSQYDDYILQVDLGGEIKKIPTQMHAANLEEENERLKKEVEKLRDKSRSRHFVENAESDNLITENNIKLKPLQVEPVKISKSDEINAIVSSVSCVKNVFNKYCLGGDAIELPRPLEKKVDGEMTMLMFSGPVRVNVVKGKIAQVSRSYPKMTWMKYQSLLSRVEKANGISEDLSYYPAYASSAENKAAAISLEKGRAYNTWKKDGYTVELGWTGVNTFLIYDHIKLKEVMDYFDQGEGF